MVATHRLNTIYNLFKIIADAGVLIWDDAGVIAVDQRLGDSGVRRAGGARGAVGRGVITIIYNTQQ